MSKLILLTKGKCAVVDDEDYENLSSFRWHYAGAGYAARRRLKAEGGYDKILYMHRVILGQPDGLDVDHINGNKLDNRRENLRAVTHQQNMLNWNGRSGSSTSKYRGVSWDKCRNLWKAQIQVKGVNAFIGRFTTEDEAALAYNEQAIKHFGAFARPNKVKVTA